MKHNTQVLVCTDPARDTEPIQLAAAVLRSGGLVAFPTETVYGLGANALDPQAVERIFAAKGRPRDNPLIAHIAGMDQTVQLAREVPDSALALASAFWPGPLTMILKKTSLVPDEVSGGLDTVALRMPSHPVARALLRQCRLPLAAPSANLSGSPSPTAAEHCVRDLTGRVEMILDGGPCQVGLESTVISLAEETPRLLRPGAVTLSHLRRVLGQVEVDRAVLEHVSEDEPVHSPGMKYKHYAPRAQLTLVTGGWQAFAAYLAGREEEGVLALVFDEDLERPLPVPAIGYGPAGDSSAQASRLFAVLRELDEKNAVKVYARTPCKKGVGMAVYNRLIRAAGFREITLE